MYRCSSSLGNCIRVSAYNVNPNNCLCVDSKRIGQDLKVLATFIPNNIFLGVSANIINKHLKVQCSVVCTVNTSRFIIVEPQYLWLTPENYFTDDIDVISNTIWDVI